MFQKIAKHRANDASNDVHRPPLVLLAYCLADSIATRSHVNTDYSKLMSLEKNSDIRKKLLFKAIFAMIAIFAGRYFKYWGSFLITLLFFLICPTSCPANDLKSSLQFPNVLHFTPQNTFETSKFI